ncbi:MAG: hypothetical protein WCF23_18120 [Candidatus Nitrosopolaris sp.]
MKKSKLHPSPWQEAMVKALNEISKDWLKELQTETGQIGNKGDYQLGLTNGHLQEFYL